MPNIIVLGVAEAGFELRLNGSKAGLISLSTTLFHQQQKAPRTCKEHMLLLSFEIFILDHPSSVVSEG